MLAVARENFVPASLPQALPIVPTIEHGLGHGARPRRLLLGSQAAEVLSRSKVPVLIVK